MPYPSSEPSGPRFCEGLALLALPVLTWLGVCPTLVLMQVPAVSWWAFQRICLLFCSTGGWLFEWECWLAPCSSFLSSLVYRTTVMDARRIYPAATKGHCPHCCGDVPGHDQEIIFLPWQWGRWRERRWSGEKDCPSRKDGGCFSSMFPTIWGKTTEHRCTV